MSKESCQPDLEKTKEQLLQEVTSLRQQVAELEASQSRQQRRLQLNRQRLNLVLRSSDIGIWLCDLPALQLEWDAKCKEHFGLPPRATVTVKQFLKRLRPDDRKGIRRALQRAIQHRTLYDVTCCLKAVDGQTRWIRMIGSVFYDETGQPSRFDGITMNVTGQKLQEEERDHLLYREQVARETAEAANRVKDEFLGVLSHELRSPLNPILGWSRLLQKRTFDPTTTQRALQTIERNAKHQTQLIEDLLDVSRILRGKLTLNICAVDLVEVLEATLKTVHLAAEAKSIQIHTQFDPHIGPVAGDPVRLQQIFWNLLSNAIKFTAAEGRVEVKLERMKTAGENQPSSLPHSGSPLPAILAPLPAHCAQITISDTGRGVSADFLPYVFDYFRQANASTTRKFGGLGLGLAIVRHLVELHGGTIHASSPGEGQGSTFTVFLPLSQSEPDKDDRFEQRSVRDSLSGGAGKEEDGRMKDDQMHSFSPPPAEASADLTNSYPSSFKLSSSDFSSFIFRPALAGIRVLVIDPQFDTREVVTFALRQFGAETTVARSPHAALQAITAHPPDILLIVLDTPDQDGYQLMQQIRRLAPEQGGQVPAIAQTSYSGEYNQERALAAGFQSHMSQSIEPEEWVAAIAKLIRPTPPASQAQQNHLPPD